MANQFISHGSTTLYNPTKLSHVWVFLLQNRMEFTAYHTDADALLEEVVETVYSTDRIPAPDQLRRPPCFTYQTGYKNPTSISNYNSSGDKIIQKSKYAYDNFPHSPPGTAASVLAMMNQDYRFDQYIGE